MLHLMKSEEVDFLIIGSGAAGMAAALRAHDLGLHTVIVEKSEHFGGSTAMSGGVCWLPNNPNMKLPDSDAEALTYLQSITGDEGDTAALEAYIQQSQRMHAYVTQNSHLRFDPIDKYSDYYPESPGGKAGGRSSESRPFDGSRLGAYDYPTLKAKSWVSSVSQLSKLIPYSRAAGAVPCSWPGYFCVIFYAFLNVAVLAATPFCMRVTL
jgi:3-oxosteroid 1-dehydrogenase